MHPQSTQSMVDSMILNFISFMEDKIILSCQYLVFFLIEKKVETKIMSFYLLLFLAPMGKNGIYKI